MENSRFFEINYCQFVFCKHDVIKSLKEFEPKYDLMIYDDCTTFWRTISHTRNITEAKKHAKNYLELGYIV